MTLLIVFVAMALGISFVCSIAEAVLLSITPAYVALLQEKGKRSGEMLFQLKENVDRPLTAILTLNTIAKLEFKQLNFSVMSTLALPREL